MEIRSGLSLASRRRFSGFTPAGNFDFHAWNHAAELPYHAFELARRQVIKEDARR